MCHFLLENYSDAMLDLTEYLDSEYSNIVQRGGQSSFSSVNNLIA